MPVALTAVGDIGMCGYKEVEATARLVRGLPGPLLALGDIAYMNGSIDDFARCYDPFYGAFRDRTFPVPGNHEYGTPGAAPYFAYFGANAGTPGAGYYSYEVGSWLVVALNSNIPMHEGSAQAQWLRATLSQSRRRCTLAYWHHPLVSSGPNGNNNGVRPLWRILQEHGADVVLSGHDHLYERFTPQDAEGRADANGMRLFIAGTGGAYLYDFVSRPSTSEVRAAEHGVLRLTLGDGRYEWEFLPIEGRSFRDSGQDTCH